MTYKNKIKIDQFIKKQSFVRNDCFFELYLYDGFIPSTKRVNNKDMDYNSIL